MSTKQIGTQIAVGVVASVIAALIIRRMSTRPDQQARISRGRWA